MWVAGSPAYNVVNEDLFDILQNDVHYFQSIGSTLLCGDFNARVADRKDYIECDSYFDCIDSDDYFPMSRYLDGQKIITVIILVLSC